MEKEEHRLTLTLFDFYWFHSSVLGASSLLPPPLPLPPPTAAAPPEVLLDRRSEEVVPPWYLRSLPPPKHQPILSGKASAVESERASLKHGIAEPHHVPKTPRARKRRSSSSSSERSSRSLSDLEFEELKGFMDLGFTFSAAEADPRLMTIVPGLHRLKFGSAADVVIEESSSSSPSTTSEESSSASVSVSVSRPYLSEAWDAEEDPLRNWRIRAVGEGVDLKDQLRLWAHTVASTVR